MCPNYVLGKSAVMKQFCATVCEKVFYEAFLGEVSPNTSW